MWRDLLDYDAHSYLMTAEIIGVDQSFQATQDNQQKLRADDQRPALYLGLVPGHAYAMMSCIELKGNGKQKIRLCQLHNPWGSLEWTGDWSESSPLWTKELRRELMMTMNSQRSASFIETRNKTSLFLGKSSKFFGIQGLNDDNDEESVDTSNDGLFWMSYEDLCRYCVRTTVCFTRHEKYSNIQPFVPWNIQRRKFYFDFDFVVPPCEQIGNLHRHNYVQMQEPRRPVYELDVEEDGDFIFSIHQTDRRIYGAQPYMDIGLVVYMHDETQIARGSTGFGHKFKRFIATKLAPERQLCTDQTFLRRGHYLIVPCATGNELFQSWLKAQYEKRHRGDEIHTHDIKVGNARAHVSTQLVEQVVGTEQLYFSKPVLTAFGEVFDHLDSDNDGRVNKNDFDHYFQRTGKQKITQEEFLEFIRAYAPEEMSKPFDEQGFNPEQFQRVQWHLFTRNGNLDEAQLLRDFTVMGFDNQLILVDGRPCGLVVHSTSKRYWLKGLPFYEEEINNMVCH